MDGLEQTYLKGKGLCCPVCGSNNIMYVGDESQRKDLMVLTRDIECHDCESEWKDEYKLSGFIDLKKASE